MTKLSVCCVALALLCICAIAQTGYVPPPQECSKQTTKEKCETAYNNCAWCFVSKTCTQWKPCKHAPSDPLLKICSSEYDKHYGWNVDGVTACSEGTVFEIFIFGAIGLAAVCGYIWICLGLVECFRKHRHRDSDYEALKD